LVKIELEVPDNVMRLLKKFCEFTGVEVKQILEQEIAALPDTMLSSAWPSYGLRVTSEEILKHYNLDDP
jgi:hypothetical protein